jgi:outer membrane protein TolC
MRFIYLVVLTTFVFANSSQAQQTSSSFTLEQAITYALENSNEIKNSALDERIANATVKETRGLGLPQIAGSASVLHNQQLSRFFTTYNPNGGFIELNPVPAGLNPGDVIAAQNFFQLKSNGQVGLEVNQLLFNASYLVGLKAANAYKQLASKQAQQTREQTIENVTIAYYGALINQERITLFDVNIGRVDSLLTTTKALYKNGFVEEIDVNRTEVTLNNLQAEREKFINLQKLSIELLKFQMNYPLDKEIALATTIETVKLDSSIESLAADWDYKSRTEYQILETNRELQNLNIKNRYAEGLPSLVAFANLAYNTQSPNVSGLFKTNTSISDNSGIGPDKWYPASSFGVSLNVPIFSGLSRQYRVQKEKLNALKIENGFTSLKQGIDLEIKSGLTMYNNSLKSLDTQSNNMKLAEKIARVTKVKYQEGVGSSLEVVDAEGSLREAQINYYNALYDALVSRVDLMKAYGKIETLNTPTSQN